MGMYTESYTDNTIGNIDENYRGIYGCLQIVSDAIHNEQVMFESLFADDYMDALNEAEEESAEEKGPNVIQKMGAFILKMIKDLRAKIDSIINDFISKADSKKSKRLKELSAKLPSGLTVDDDKVKKLIDKYGYEAAKIADGNFKERFEELYKAYKVMFDNKKMDTSRFFAILSDGEGLEDQNSEKFTKLYEQLILSLSAIAYNPKDDPNVFLKNLHDPSYIIDSVVKDLRDMRSKTKSILDMQEKEIKYSISQAKKDKDKELVRSLKKNKIVVSVINLIIPKMIANLTKATVYTYKAYISSLEYLTKDSKKADKKSGSTNSKEDDDTEVLQGTVESVEYQVDMEFDIL